MVEFDHFKTEWMCNTIEFIGIWEELNNPDFKGNEFVTFKTQAGSNMENGGRNHIIGEEYLKPDFNYPEFGVIKNEAGLNRFTLSIKKCIRINGDLH